MGTLTEVFGKDNGMGLYRVWVFGILRFGTIMKLHGWTLLSPTYNFSQYFTVNSSKPIMNWEEDSYLISKYILFLLDLTSNQVVFDGFVHSLLLFRLKFQLPPKCKIQNMKEHNAK